MQRETLTRYWRLGRKEKKSKGKGIKGKLWKLRRAKEKKGKQIEAGKAKGC